MTAPVRSRLLLRVRDCVADCPKEILEWSRFRHFGRGEQSEDRQPGDNCAERPFHNHLNRINRLPRASFRLQIPPMLR